MNGLLHNVVYAGLADYWKPQNVSLIGKTGTAQIADPKGGYQHGEYDYIKSFAGIFPEENPKYIIYISVKKMVGSTKDLATVVTKTVDEIANYANINYKKEEEKVVTKVVTLNNYVNTSVDNSKIDLENQGITPVIIGTGDRIIKQFPSSNTKVIRGEKVFLLLNQKPYVMPNVLGWSSSDIILFCKLTGMKYEINGYGTVSAVSIPEGTPITGEELLVVNLES